MNSINYEPTDPPQLPVVPVTREAFDGLARDRSARIEPGCGGPDVVVLRGVEYVAVAS